MICTSKLYCMDDSDVKYHEQNVVYGSEVNKSEINKSNTFEISELELSKNDISEVSKSNVSENNNNKIEEFTEQNNKNELKEVKEISLREACKVNGMLQQYEQLEKKLMISRNKIEKYKTKYNELMSTVKNANNVQYSMPLMNTNNTPLDTYAKQIKDQLTNLYKLDDKEETLRSYLDVCDNFCKEVLSSMENENNKYK